jgi:predicted aconitase
MKQTCHSAAMVQLSKAEHDIASGSAGPARAMAMRIVSDTARLLGAAKLIPIESAHIDGCLYHGDSGTLFAERLVEDGGGAVAVPTTLNVGALDLLHAGRVRLAPERAAMARRMMDAYLKLGCRPTWTCAPYQAGHRPAPGTHVAWGESNAVAFCNSVLGARTERYGDFLDICAALSGRAPEIGLHLDDNRRPTLLVDCGGLDRRLVEDDAFWPVLGAWLGETVAGRIVAFTGLPREIAEDRLKAMGAAAASTGSVGLFHIEGVTPERFERPRETLVLMGSMLQSAFLVRRISAAACGARGAQALDPSLCLHRPAYARRSRARGVGPGRAHGRGRHLHRGDADPAIEQRSLAHQLGQVRALHTAQHRLRCAVRLAHRLRRNGGRRTARAG